LKIFFKKHNIHSALNLLSNLAFAGAAARKTTMLSCFLLALILVTAVRAAVAWR
jgi:hypothetical protein